MICDKILSIFQLVELDKKLHELKNLQTAIEEYIKKGGHARLEKIRNELQELQLEKDRNHEQRTRMEKEIDSIKQFRHTQQVRTKLQYFCFLLNFDSFFHRE